MRIILAFAFGFGLAACCWSARTCTHSYRIGPLMVWSRQNTPFCNAVANLERNPQ